MEMNPKGNYEREEKDKSDFLTFLRAAAAAAKQRQPSEGEKHNPDKKSKDKFPENNLPASCNECSLMSRNASFLTDHKQNGHSAIVARIESFSCSNCDFASFGRNGLTTHIRVEHQLEDARILSNGCRLCSEGQIHSICDFEQKLQTSEGKGETFSFGGVN